MVINRKPLRDLQMVVYAVLQIDSVFFNRFYERKLGICCKNTRMLKKNILYMKLLHYWLQIIVI